MLNNSQIVGFIGIDKYEIILYLANVLVKLEKKVLLIDAAETSALSYCFSVPGDVDLKRETITHVGLDYTKNLDLELHKEKYDVILIDYGFSFRREDLEDHNSICLVTDKQLHNLNRLSKVKAANQDTFLLLKNIDKADNINQIKYAFSKDLKIINVYPFSTDNVDQIHTYSLQYGKEMRVKILSYEYKQIMKRFVIDLLGITEKEYKEAFKKLKRGA